MTLIKRYKQIPGSKPGSSEPAPGPAYFPYQPYESPADKQKRQFKQIAFYTFGTILLGSAAFFTARHFIRKRKANKVEDKSLTDNTPENYAKRLKMGFDNDGWWGTDVDMVRAVFVDIPTKLDFAKTVKAYATLTKGKNNLIADLGSELTTTEYTEMQNILASKPDKPGQKKIFDYNRALAIAKRFKAAFDYTVLGFPATDLGAVKQALIDVPTKYYWAVEKVVYKKIFGSDLESDLDSELDILDFSWRNIINAKPSN